MKLTHIPEPHARVRKETFRLMFSLAMIIIMALLIFVGIEAFNTPLPSNWDHVALMFYSVSATAMVAALLLTIVVLYSNKVNEKLKNWPIYWIWAMMFGSAVLTDAVAFFTPATIFSEEALTLILAAPVAIGVTLGFFEHSLRSDMTLQKPIFFWVMINLALVQLAVLASMSETVYLDPTVWNSVSMFLGIAFLAALLIAAFTHGYIKKGKPLTWTQRAAGQSFMYLCFALGGFCVISHTKGPTTEIVTTHLTVIGWAFLALIIGTYMQRDAKKGAP